jgi:hypothetical protein
MQKYMPSFRNIIYICNPHRDAKFPKHTKLIKIIISTQFKVDNEVRTSNFKKSPFPEFVLLLTLI